MAISHEHRKSVWRAFFSSGFITCLIEYLTNKNKYFVQRALNNGKKYIPNAPGKTYFKKR